MATGASVAFFLGSAIVAAGFTAAAAVRQVFGGTQEIYAPGAAL